MRLSKKHRRHLSDRTSSSLGISSRLVSSRGVLEVLRLGQGEPLILVPGLAGGWRLLAPLARRLARRNEVILYGLRGDRGPSGGSSSETVETHAEDLADLINSLGLELPTVLGVSFGGAVALELAANTRGVVGGLVVQGVEARFHKSMGSSIALAALEHYPLPVNNPFLNQFFNLLHGGSPESQSLAEFVVERCWETDQGTMARRLRSLEAFDVSDRLWQVEAPTLVLGGTRDAVIPIGRQRSLAKAIPGAQFRTLEGAGHIGFLTHKLEFANSVNGFIATQNRSFC